MKTIHNTKIIGIDHGYGNMKTANFNFPTGITAYTLGDTGGAVFVIQGILQAIQNNFPKIPPISNSGVFDTATQNAVKQFQSYTPLPADGVVDAATWNHLLAALDAEIRNSAGVV